jgi:hypothetical protein
MSHTLTAEAFGTLLALSELGRLRLVEPRVRSELLAAELVECSGDFLLITAGPAAVGDARCRTSIGTTGSLRSARYEHRLFGFLTAEANALASVRWPRKLSCPGDPICLSKRSISLTRTGSCLSASPFLRRSGAWRVRLPFGFRFASFSAASSSPSPPSSGRGSRAADSGSRPRHRRRVPRPRRCRRSTRRSCGCRVTLGHF